MFPVEVWGTVGQWFGSGLTGGSLLLGFSILRINQRDKIREQARQVMFTEKLSTSADTGYVSLARGTIYNSSDAPITDAYIGVRLNEHTRRKQFWRAHLIRNPLAQFVSLQEIIPESLDEFATLEPKAKHEFTKRIDALARRRDVEVVLLFKDARGRYWTLDSEGVLTEDKKPQPGLRMKTRLTAARIYDKLSMKKAGDRYSVTP